MKNLISILLLGVFLYIIMGGNIPSFTHYLGDDDIVYDGAHVAGDDVFIGLHVVQDEDGSSRVTGVSHWGRLLRSRFWSGLFGRDAAVRRSQIAQVSKEKQATVPGMPCDITFVDVNEDDAGRAVDLLGDLCVVRGVGSRFFPTNHTRRSDALTMTVRAMMHAYQADVPQDMDSSYDDVPSDLQALVAQLELWGLDDELARSEDVFGVDDVVARDDLVVFLEEALASLPGHIPKSDTLIMPLSSDYVARETFAHMLVSGLRLERSTSSLMASK